MLELEHEFRVVDFHLELEPAETRRPRGIGDPEQVEREMRQAGIVQSVVFPDQRDGSYLKANNAVARVAVDRPFVPVARINGARDPGTGAGSRLRNVTRSRGEHHTSPADIEQYGYEDRFIGFMVNPVVDGLPEQEILEAIESVEMPVITYGGHGFPPDVIEETLLTYDIPVVVAHCGSYPLDREMMSDTIDLLSKHEEMFVNTSYARFRDPLERAVMEHPDRVIFGSGAPATHPDVAVMEILTLNVPEDAMRKVFWKNAARVLEELAP